jgi:hypothetical protein
MVDWLFNQRWGYGCAAYRPPRPSCLQRHAATPDEQTNEMSHERLRGLRTLTLLERVGTPAARKILKTLAREAGDSVVQVDASAAQFQLVQLASSGSR